MRSGQDNASIAEMTSQSQIRAGASPDPGSAVSAIRAFFLKGPAGRLEALLNEGRRDAGYSSLLCHPHPQGGGTMHNKVVYHAAKVFSGLGWPVLRFNFRGTGLSEGEHDGNAEVEDVRAGLDWLKAQYGLPIIAAGFSFGSAIGIRAASGYPGKTIAGFAALGLPTHADGRDYRYPELAECTFPKLFLSGDQDRYAPASQLKALVDLAAKPKKLVLIDGADHFFMGKLPAMQAALATWLNDKFLSERSSEPESTSR